MKSVSLLHVKDEMRHLSMRLVFFYHDIYENSELHAITDADHRFTGQYKKSASDLTAQFLKPLF